MAREKWLFMNDSGMRETCESTAAGSRPNWQLAVATGGGLVMAGFGGLNSGVFNEALGIVIIGLGALFGWIDWGRQKKRAQVSRSLLKMLMENCVSAQKVMNAHPDAVAQMRASGDLTERGVSMLEEGAEKKMGQVEREVYEELMADLYPDQWRSRVEKRELGANLKNSKINARAMRLRI